MLERVVVRRQVAFRRGRPGPACDVVVVVGRASASYRRPMARVMGRRTGVCAGRLLERRRRRQKQARHRRTECQSDDRHESQPSPGAKVATSRTHRLTLIHPYRKLAVGGIRTPRGSTGWKWMSLSRPVPRLCMSGYVEGRPANPWEAHMLPLRKATAHPAVGQQPSSALVVSTRRALGLVRSTSFLGCCTDLLQPDTKRHL